MSAVNHHSAAFVKRIIFDLSFYIWVALVLFNVITGLVVDGFGALRAEDTTRRQILENTCFACGFTRMGYDDLPNFRGPSFDTHRDVDHNYWVFVEFYVYLYNKPIEDMTGVESYVWSHLEEQSLAWIPVRNSAAIQNAHAHVEDEDPGIDPEVISRIASEVKDIKRAVEAHNPRHEPI
jgi:hypothetical protein